MIVIFLVFFGLHLHALINGHEMKNAFQE
jgi:hypothetical protein